MVLLCRLPTIGWRSCRATQDTLPTNVNFATTKTNKNKETWTQKKKIQLNAPFRHRTTAAIK